MNIICVTACAVGIAHTYLSQEKIEQAAKKAGHNVKVETQGTIGIENELTEDDVRNADIMIIAADVKIANEERFEKIPTLKVSTDVAIKSPNKLIKKCEEVYEKIKGSKND